MQTELINKITNEKKGKALMSWELITFTSQYFST